MRKRKAGRPPLAGEAMGLYAFRLPDSLVTRADALRALGLEALARHKQ